VLPHGTLLVWPPCCKNMLVGIRSSQRAKKDPRPKNTAIPIQLEGRENARLTLSLSSSKPNSWSYVVPVITEIEDGSIGFPSAGSRHFSIQVPYALPRCTVVATI